MIFTLIFAFLLTIILEFLIIYLILRKDWKKLLLYVLLINCFTWPLATISYYSGINYYLIEICVVLVESVLLTLLLRKKYLLCLSLSFLANLVTALVGFLL